MEDTLRAYKNVNCSTLHGLNPYYNGRYSQSFYDDSKIDEFLVLILIIMEDTLREFEQEMNLKYVAMS